MLKIKNKVDLRELEKYGFYYNDWEMRYEREVERIYEEAKLVINDREILLECIGDYGFDGDEYYIEETKEVESYIQDLIKANLVEKVED